MGIWEELHSMTWKEYKSKETYYLIRIRPFFKMSQEMVNQFKKAGYKWVKYDRWELEKTECSDIIGEKEFIKSFGEQRWTYTIQPDVGKYTKRCISEECNYEKTKFFMIPA